MAVIFAACLYILMQVNDVTAQSCVIGPNLTELTIRNPLERNVELHCQCLDIIGEVTETWWFSGSNSMITRMNSSRVHSTNTNPSRLIIGSRFTNNDAGVYTCANADTLSSASVSDMITLEARGDPGGVVTCTITSTNIPDLTDAGGPILIGTKNVIIYCICRRSNSAAVGPTLWSHNGTGVPTANSNPFYRNNVPAPLIFASIASNHTGTYQCARQGAGQSDTADTITLTAQACVIRPNVGMRTLRNPLGRIVEFHCRCVNSDGTETEAMWWFQDGNSITLAPTRNFSNLANPALYIPSPFDNSKDGTYICSPGMANDPTRDTVTLNLGTDNEGPNTICNIVSTNLPTVTTAGGPIISGTTNVILYCICNRNVVVGQTRWFFNGTLITLTLDDGSGNPYSRDNVPSPLIIPSFVAPHNGTYSCGPNNNSADVTDSITLTLLVLVDPPNNVMATVITPRSIMITWTPSPSPNVTGYLISYTTDASYISMNDRSQSIPVGNTTTVTINNVEEDTTYTITVQSNSSDGLSRKSNVETVTTQASVPSSPPQNVMVTGIPRASLNVSWQPPPPIDHNGPITGYMIQYTRDSRSSDPMTMNVSSVTRQVIIPSLTAFVDYSVTVAAVNSAGTGNFSDAMVVRSGQNVPTAPRSLMAVGSTDTSVTLSWMPPDPPNGMITRYNVMYRILDGGSFTTVNTMATDLTYTVTELTTATEYRFRVTASTVVGEGARSNAVNVFVGLLAPTKVRATMLTPRSVEVTWTPSLSSGVTGYLISYTTDASYIGLSNRSRSMTIDNTTTGTLTDLEEGTTYSITVQATARNNLKSGNSNAETVTTQTIAPSSPPLDVMVATFDPASLMVSWQPPPPIDHNGPITGYMIQYTKDGSSDLMSVNVTNGTTYTISGLPVSTEYSVRVAAMNVNGTGRFSNPMINRSGEDRPSKPESLDIIGVNSSSVMLKWRPPLTRNGVIILYSLKYNSTILIVTNTSDDVLMYTVGGLSSENVYIFQVTAHTRAGEGPPINITVTIPPSPVAVVTISNDTITSSSLTLSWIEVNLTNSVLIHYTVFYLPVSGPYDRIMASRRKRQSAQAEEFTMDFTSGTNGTLTGLNGSVTYRIQVAAVVMLNVNGQVVTGDRSSGSEITTPEGVPTYPRDLSAMVTDNEVTLTWSRPDPPNGLITQYSVSYINTNTQDSNITIIPVVNGGDENLNYTQTGLSQGTYNFIVVASTANGTGEAANVTQSVFGTGDSGGGSGGAAVAGGVIGGLLAVAVIIIIIIIVIYLRRRQGESSFVEKSPKAEKSNVVPLKDIADGKSAGSYEPEIIGLPSELRATEGQTFSFPSHVTGKPVPDVYWYLNSRDMTEDDTAVISSNGQLTLTLVSIDHAGEWRCQATNSSGSTEASTRLIVAPGKAKPLPSPRPDRKHKPIPVSEFGIHVNMLHENSNQGFKAEYESFFNGEGMSVAVGSAPNNKPKNRFANIVAYDENRVILGPCGPYKDDYVNASPLDGYKHPRCYIAAQAPVTKTLADFWRLIWQEHPPTIVMVTNLKEGEKVKCVQYWPNTVGETQTYGPLNVSLTEEFEFADYVVRTVELRNTAMGNQLHVVTQYHFTAWPDHGVPDYATAILAFHRRLRGTHQASIGPLLVHCSAGVGRTGTFITIDTALEQIKAEGVVAIYNIVDKLRHQRPHMVQSQEQYMFIHDAILESITCGNTQVSAADLQRAVTKLKQRDPHTKLTGYEQQYKVLQQVSPRLEDQVSNSALKNPDKNRPNHCHPMEKGRVILRKEKSDYINASFLKGYKQDKAFIVAQSPMKNTVRDFWKMIYDRQCASIVMLCEIMEDGREVCTPYWPQTGAFTYGDMTVTNINTAESKEFTTRVFKINEQGSSNTRQVTQFHYHSWGPHKTPNTPANLLVLIEEVQRVQRSTGNKPIVVHCSNVLGRTGSFCAIFTILDRFKVEQVIDVLQTVKLLRIKRPGIVEDLDQYQFLFTVVVRYLQSFDTYSNFQI